MITEKLVENYPQEFINRTEKILEQYTTSVGPKLQSENKESEYYDVTLFINCLYGLLMMPSKLYYDNLKEASKNKTANEFLKENKLSKVIYFTTTPNKEISLLEFIRSIRNGMAHWEDENKILGFDYEPKEEGSTIKKIIITGSTKKDHGIFTKVTMDISSDDNRKKILAFLEWIYNK